MSLDSLNKEIHVWSVKPESVRDNHTLDNCLSMLSESEVARYERLRSPEHRHCYLVSHALVRQALSKYVGIDPSAWEFQSGPNGRPEICTPGCPPIRFNLTHTSDFSACIISLEDLCGIDAERLDSRHNLSAVAKRMFSNAEYIELKKLSGKPQLDYFFSRWTLREAYVKALGVGISFPTRKLSFDIISADDIRIAFDADIQDNPANWRFKLLRPTDSHVAAVALREQRPHSKKILIRAFHFS